MRLKTGVHDHEPADATREAALFARSSTGHRYTRDGANARILAIAALFVGATLAVVPVPSIAGTWRLDINLASTHTQRWARDTLNQRNPGAGVTWQASRTWAVAGGVYSNSYRRPSAYALAEFTPLQIGDVNGWHADAGFAAGLASGYRRAEIPCEPLVGGAVLRVVSPSGIAMHLFGVPNTGAYRSGFVGFQLSVPLATQQSGRP